MSKATNDSLVTINVDGKELEVPAGMNVIEAVAQHGIEIPHYCYHPKLSVSGNCRMCLVEMGMPMKDRKTGEPILNDDGTQKIGWMPKPGIACNSKTSPGLHLKTTSEMTLNAQKGVMEFLLINHPLDCPICDQAGECRLQEFSTDYGRGYSRFIENKVVKPKRTVLGPRVTLDDERCILCSRCIRFSKEIAKDDVLGFTNRGSYSTLSCYPGKKLENNYSLNTVDICPVGALTSTDFRFQMRVWFLKQTKSICTESSVGVNTTVWSREGKIYRITPRQNDAVNDTWMTDSGRSLYKQVEAKDRLKIFHVNDQKSTRDEAIKRAVELLSVGKVAFIGSGYMSTEEQYLLSKLAQSTQAPTYILQHLGDSDDLLLSKDHTPNMRGAYISKFKTNGPDEDLSDLQSQIESGSIETILVFHEDLTQHGFTVSQLNKLNIIFIGTHESDTSHAAEVALPGVTVFEKSGTFINQQFRLQKFHQAVPAPEDLIPESRILTEIINRLKVSEADLSTISQIWTVMSTEIPEFQDLSFNDIPDEGLLLDSSACSSLPSPEGKTLHFDPTTH